MLKRVRIFVCLVLMSFWLNNAFSQEQGPLKPDPEFLQQLDTLSTQRDLGPLFLLAASPKTHQQLKAALDWMHKKAFYSDSRDPRYLMSYSGLLDLARVRDSSAAAYVAGLLIGRVEAARCADPTAMSSKMFSIESQTKRLEKNYWELPLTLRQQVLFFAFSLEGKKPLGKANAWLCGGGLDDVGSVLRKEMEGAGENSIQISRGDKNGSPVEVRVDTSGIEPAAISNEQLSPKRREIRDAVLRYFEGDVPKRFQPVNQ